MKYRTSCFFSPSLSVQLYVEVLKENGILREKLQETQLQLSECKVELERLRQVCVCVAMQDDSTLSAK